MKMLSKEELYKRNQKKIKVFGIMSPIVFWVFVALAIICAFFALKNSFGNIDEMISLLDTQKFDGEELQANYNFLIDKYGEWVIGNGNKGFQLVFINIKAVVFNGVMVLFSILAFIFFISAYVIGKWCLPFLKEKIKQDNQDMVNLTILKDSERK